MFVAYVEDSYLLYLFSSLDWLYSIKLVHLLITDTRKGIFNEKVNFSEQKQA